MQLMLKEKPKLEFRRYIKPKNIFKKSEIELTFWFNLQKLSFVVHRTVKNTPDGSGSGSGRVSWFDLK